MPYRTVCSESDQYTVGHYDCQSLFTAGLCVGLVCDGSLMKKEENGVYRRTEKMLLTYLVRVSIHDRYYDV